MKSAFRIFNGLLRVVLFLILGASVLCLYVTRRDRAAKRTISSAIPLLESYREAHGGYPASIEDIALPRTLVFGFLPAAEIRYRTDESGYTLTYAMLPLGPMHGYASGSQGWISEE
jgi:hypothetical protein